MDAITAETETNHTSKVEDAGPLGGAKIKTGSLSDRSELRKWLAAFHPEAVLEMVEHEPGDIPSPH